MTTQIERGLQTEAMLRLRMLPVVAIPIPNGVWIPSRTPEERNIAARIIARMKSDGMLLPGAPDLVIAGPRGAILAELKRGASRDLFTKRPAGRQSDDQREFQKRCEALGVRYVIVHDWSEIKQAIETVY